MPRLAQESRARCGLSKAPSDSIDKTIQDRFKFHANLQERLDIIETGLVREDVGAAGSASRLLGAQLAKPAGVGRSEFDGEVNRIWQAIDSHTHQPDVKGFRSVSLAAVGATSLSGARLQH